MSLFKYIAIGLMLISVAFPLIVNMPTNLNMSQGEAKDIQINISNTINTNNDIGVFGYSDNVSILVIPSGRTIDMTASSSTNTTFTINSRDAKPGSYLVRFTFASTEENYVFTRTLNVTIRPMINIDPVYRFVRVTQGDYVTLKFIITNLDTSGRSMLIDPESFPVEFNAEYPDPFYMGAGESKTVSIRVTIPADYHSGLHTLKLTILSGEVSADSAVFDVSVTKSSAYKDLVNINAVELGGYTSDNGQKGYNLMLRIENRKSEAITGVEVTGFPLGWNVTGETPFDIGANSIKDVTIQILPKDLSEYTLAVLLTKNDLVLTNTTLTFSGAKMGLVGQAFLGGSLTIGMLIIVIAVLVLLYIRQRNVQTDESEKMDRVGYLKDLVEEAKNK